MKHKQCKFLPILLKCSKDQDKRVFSLKAPGTNNTIRFNVNSRRCRKLQIDGALEEVSPYKCDWCLWDYDKNEYLFVELKGDDFSHAVEQLECTIQWFVDNIYPFSIHKKTYIVMNKHSSIPSFGTIKQVSERIFVKQFKTILKCTHSGQTLCFCQQKA